MKPTKNHYDDFKPTRNKIRSLNFLSAVNRLYLLVHQKKPVITPEIGEFFYLNLVVYAEGVQTDTEEKFWNKIIDQCVALNHRITDAQIKRGLWKWVRILSLNQLRSHGAYYLDVVYRYYYIFSAPGINSHIEERLGVPYKSYFMCGIWLHAVFSKKLAYSREYFTRKNNGGPRFAIENMEKALALLSIPLAPLRTQLKEAMSFDEDTFIFQGYPHIIRPIFELDHVLYCMYPDDLLKQLVSGIYYIAAIGDQASNVSAEYGKAFENYVGIVLDKNNKAKDVRVRPEITYAVKKSQVVKTSDWIIETSDAIVFIECKTKRLSLGSKKMMEVEDKSPEDLLALAKAITQLYKVYEHYKDGLIPGLTYAPEKKFFPLVITLEEWFADGPDDKAHLTKEVINLLDAQGLSGIEVAENHFRTYSINAFESDVQEMFYLGFVCYFRHLAEGTLKDALKDFTWKPYFETEYKDLLYDGTSDKLRQP